MVRSAPRRVFGRKITDSSQGTFNRGGGPELTRDWRISILNVLNINVPRDSGERLNPGKRPQNRVRDYAPRVNFTPPGQNYTRKWRTLRPLFAVSYGRQVLGRRRRQVNLTR
jgi:hypothetical protein